MWFLYMIKTQKGKLYTGITTDYERRFLEHCEGRGAKYFRTDRPQEIVYIEFFDDRSQASIREAEIKSLNRPQKDKLIQSSRSVSS